MNLQEAIESIQKHPVIGNMVFNQVIERNLLDNPIPDGVWVSKQILLYLADSYLNSYTRIKLVLTEEHPTVKSYNEAG